MTDTIYTIMTAIIHGDLAISLVINSDDSSINDVERSITENFFTKALSMYTKLTKENE